MAFEPITAALELGAKVIDRLFPDKTQAAAAQLKLLELQQSGELAAIAGQLEINKIEAANPTVFVSGWRPGCGWVCVSGLLIQFVVRPIATWTAALLGHPIVFPELDMGTLLTLLAGMLGLSGLRTYEKTQGVAAK